MRTPNEFTNDDLKDPISRLRISNDRNKPYLNRFADLTNQQMYDLQVGNKYNHREPNWVEDEFYWNILKPFRTYRNRFTIGKYSEYINGANKALEKFEHNQPSRVGDLITYGSDLPAINYLYRHNYIDLHGQQNLDVNQDTYTITLEGKIALGRGFEKELRIKFRREWWLNTGFPMLTIIFLAVAAISGFINIYYVDKQTNSTTKTHIENINTEGIEEGIKSMVLQSIGLNQELKRTNHLLDSISNQLIQE